MATLNLTTIAEPYGTLGGDKRFTMGIYTGPASYTNAGGVHGDSFAPAEVGLGVIDFIDFENPVDSTPSARIVTYDVANARVLWFTAGATEVTNGTNVSTFSARFIAYGR